MRHNAKSGDVIVKSQARHSFILLRPRRVQDSERVARAMARCEGVREVYLASGSYAFVLAADCDSEERARGIYERVRKAVDSEVEMSLAINHYVYKQR